MTGDHPGSPGTAAVTAELDRRNAELDSSLDAFPDLRFRLDRHGTYLDVRTSTPEVLLVPADQLVGASVTDHFPPALAQEILAGIKRTLETGEVTALEYSVPGPQEPLHYEARLARVGPDEVLAVVRDVSELKALKQQVIHAGTMEAVGRMASGVAHDFNNVLHVVRGHAQALQRNSEDPQEVGRRLSSIIRAVDRTSSLIERLMLIGRNASGHPTQTNVDEFLITLGETLGQLLGEGVEVRYDLHADGAAIAIDNSRFEHAILNLALNARDAMDDGIGVVRIGTSVESEGTLRIVVADTGTGIPADISGRIFEPFFTTKDPGTGTGLGLATTYESVIAAGGKISVASVVDEGTIFTIDIPVLDPANHDNGPPPSGELPSNATILVVDDEADVLELCADTLRELGYRVLAALGGREAESLLAEDSIDLIITDVMMPEISGPELARSILSSHPQIPVLYMSGFMADHDANAPASASQILHKPFTADDLRAIVSTALR